MLKTILSISGKPGLYKLISQGKNMLIVETIDATKKRFPAYGNEKIISLADIAMYTNDSEVPLRDVLRSIKEILFDHFDVRLARVLLALYEKNGKKNIKITQELLAQEVNSAREVVTRMLKTFAMKGWLEVNRGCIVLKDIEALTELSNK